MACFLSTFVFGAALMGYGVVGGLFPHKVAKLGEMKDAVGSKRPPSEVEPTAWNADRTQAMAVLVGVLGLILFVAALSRC